MPNTSAFKYALNEAHTNFFISFISDSKRESSHDEEIRVVFTNEYIYMKSLIHFCIFLLAVFNRFTLFLHLRNFHDKNASTQANS